MSENINGVVERIGPIQSFGAKGFRKRELVIKQDFERWTNYLPFELVYEAVDDADELNVGDQVSVEYAPKGRKWQRDDDSEVKYFVNLQCGKFTVLSKTQQEPDAEEEYDNGIHPDAADIPF